MSSIYRSVQYALMSANYASLPTDYVVNDERDALLTLIALQGGRTRPFGLDDLRMRLESWLQHTLDQRLACAPEPDADALVRAAQQSHDDFWNWFATAEEDQRTTYRAIERGAFALDDMPLSVLYRTALLGMLNEHPDLELERRGSQALAERQLPLPPHSEWRRIVRGARWRDDVDARYLRDLHTLLATRELQSEQWKEAS